MCPEPSQDVAAGEYNLIKTKFSSSDTEETEPFIKMHKPMTGSRKTRGTYVIQKVGLDIMEHIWSMLEKGLLSGQMKAGFQENLLDLISDLLKDKYASQRLIYINKCTNYIGQNKMAYQALQLILKAMHTEFFPMVLDDQKIHSKQGLVQYLEQEFKISTKIINSVLILKRNLLDKINQILSVGGEEGNKAISSSGSKQLLDPSGQQMAMHIEEPVLGDSTGPQLEEQKLSLAAKNEGDLLSVGAAELECESTCYEIQQYLNQTNHKASPVAL